MSVPPDLHQRHDRQAEGRDARPRRHRRDLRRDARRPRITAADHSLLILPHALCAERLARYKRPVLMEVLDELPKNPVGKLDKPALRALVIA